MLYPSAVTDHDSGYMSSLSQTSGGKVGFFRLSFLKLLNFAGDVLISEYGMTPTFPKEADCFLKNWQQNSTLKACFFSAKLPSPAQTILQERLPLRIFAWARPEVLYTPLTAKGALKNPNQQKLRFSF